MASVGIPGLTDRATHLTTFTVKVEGEAIPGSYSVIAVDIARSVNRIPKARLVIHDGDAATQDFEVSSDDLLVPGKSIEINGGYSSDENLLFKGIIISQRIQVKRRGDSLLHVEAADAVFRMTLQRRSAYFTELTDSGLFEQIATGYSGISPQVEPTTGTHREIVQYRVSDWDFLVARAERLGMFCAATDGVLRIEKPKSSPPPALSLAYGQGVFDLDMEMDARLQPKLVTASAWDPASQELISSDVDDVSTPNQGNLAGSELAETAAVENYELRHTGPLEQQEIEAWATAQMTKSRFSKIRGTIRIQGTEAVKLGDLIELKGLGERFNGLAFVSGIRHTLGDGDWESVLQVGFDPEWMYDRYPISSPGGAGFNPSISGLQVGIVKQLESDPSGEDRIQVTLPVISPDEPGVWARLATLDAGENRGTVFRPEIGDEVVVGFLDDDPHHPVVLGMLHSSSKPAPLPGSDDNHEKGLTTRSGIKVLFNDDKVILTIQTPNGNQVEISDDQGQIVVEDETGNTVKLHSGGIDLESPKDIVIKANGDVSVEAININLKASASLKAEGSAGAELSSGGSTTVKGSLVQIN